MVVFLLFLFKGCIYIYIYIYVCFCVNLDLNRPLCEVPIVKVTTTRLTRRVSLVEQELFTLNTEYLSSLPVCSEVRVTRSLVFLSFFLWPLCCLFFICRFWLPLWYPQALLRERPFNLKGWGVWFFFWKKYSDSQCCWKNILILVEVKKKIWFRVFVL